MFSGSFERSSVQCGAQISRNTVPRSRGAMLNARSPNLSRERGTTMSLFVADRSAFAQIVTVILCNLLQFIQVNVFEVHVGLIAIAITCTSNATIWMSCD